MNRGITVTPNTGISALTEAVRGNLYEAMLDILGTTATIVPLLDPKHGALSGSTVTTIGDQQVIFTASEAWADFDTPPGVKNIVPVWDVNGIDEEADTPDAAFWTQASSAFSVGAWVNLADATNAYILAKYDATTASPKREWLFYIDASDYPSFQVFDESADAYLVRQYQTALPENQWHFMVGTWDGSNLVGGIKVYLNGVQVDDANVTGGSFTAQEDLAGTVTLAHSVGSGGEVFNPFDGKMAGGPLGPFFVKSELTADVVLRLYEIGRRGLNL